MLQDELGFSYPRFRRAVELAGRREWIVPGRALASGAVLPPGQYAAGAAATRAETAASAA